MIQFIHSLPKKNLIFSSGKMCAFQGHILRFNKVLPLVPEKYGLFDEKGLQFPARNGIMGERIEYLCGLPPPIL